MQYPIPTNKDVKEGKNGGVIEIFYIEKCVEPLYADCNKYGDLEGILDLFDFRLNELLDSIDAILDNKDMYNVQTYEHKGHIENIRDVKTFYDANLNLLKYKISQELFFQGGQIYTKAKDEPSTLYKNGSNVQNSIIANGCIVEGTVENSVIFRGVKIGKGVVVRNSIVMQKSIIEEDAVVVNSIRDKYVHIYQGANIVGNQAIPYVVEKNRSIKKERFV